MLRFIAFVALMLATACLILLSGFALPTVVSLTVLVFAISSDSLTTWLCLKSKGREGNPAVAFLFRKVGVFKTFGIVACVWTVFIVFRWLPQIDGIQTAVAFTYWLVVMNNLIVLIRLRRRVAHC